MTTLAQPASSETSPTPSSLHLDACRAALGSDRAVADALGVSASQVSRWRKGQTPDPDNADRLGGLALVAEMLGRWIEPETVGAWLRGANVHLGQPYALVPDPARSRSRRHRCDRGGEGGCLRLSSGGCSPGSVASRTGSATHRNSCLILRDGGASIFRGTSPRFSTLPRPLSTPSPKPSSHGGAVESVRHIFSAPPAHWHW